MIELWKYDHWDDDTGSVIPPNPWKEPYIWSFTEPSSDYTMITATVDQRVYREREQRDGKVDPDKVFDTREGYGNELFEWASAKSRIERLLLDPIPDHETYRTTHYIPLVGVKTAIKEGAFISAYEEVNKVDPTPEIPDTKLNEYRIIISMYLTSIGTYTDLFGLTVEGGKYDEFNGWTFNPETGMLQEPS